MSASDPPVLAIFDHDGVLVDSLGLHQESWVELGRREALPITADFVRETFGMTNPSIFRRLLGEDAAEAELNRLGDLKEVHYRTLAADKISLMDGVRDLLDALTAAGVKLAIGSSATRANLDLTVSACGLDGRFASIAALEDIRHGKPDPEVFLLAADRAGVEPARSVVFEDAPVGIRAAKRAGMYAVGVTTTTNETALVEAGADQVVTTLASFDVASLVKHLRRAL